MKFFSNSMQAQPITLGRWVRLNAILLGLVCLVSLSFPVSTLSQKLNDFFFRVRRPLPTSSQVALVLIDDATLEQHGRWPWPRAELAKLIRAVSAQSPKAIGVDVLLPELEDEANDAALTAAIWSLPTSYWRQKSPPRPPAICGWTLFHASRKLLKASGMYKRSSILTGSAAVFLCRNQARTDCVCIRAQAR